MGGEEDEVTRVEAHGGEGRMDGRSCSWVLDENVRRRRQREVATVCGGWA